MIFDSYLPNVGSFLLLIRRQIWTIFDPSLPKTCWRLKWMGPNSPRELCILTFVSSWLGSTQILNEEHPASWGQDVSKL